MNRNFNNFVLFYSAGHVPVAKILLEFGAGINTHSNEFKVHKLELLIHLSTFPSPSLGHLENRDISFFISLSIYVYVSIHLSIYLSRSLP